MKIKFEVEINQVSPKEGIEEYDPATFYSLFKKELGKSIFRQFSTAYPFNFGGVMFQFVDILNTEIENEEESRKEAGEKLN